MHDVVDLRSDTLTTPTAEMREAMARAPVGDDVWGEDPTVQRLEALAAERMGKEAGLYVTSGTQGNLISVLAQSQPGQEVILDLDSHIYNYEVGGRRPHRRRADAARSRPRGGSWRRRRSRRRSGPPNIHLSASALVCLENTHNRHGGTCCTPEEIDAVARVAHEHGLRVHLDGARLFNAAVALGREAREFARDADSVTFCLSKGLGAPVGSVVCGSADFVARARRWRKMLGGGMRQAGVIAAAGLVALERMVDRLAEDHANARALAEASRAGPASPSTSRPCRRTSSLSVDGPAEHENGRAGPGMRRAEGEGSRHRSHQHPVCDPQGRRRRRHRRAVDAVREIATRW